MDWTNKNIHPSKVAQVGDEVEVMILDIDPERRRISLGIKQCQPNPWEEFAATHNKGDKSRTGEEAVRDYKKGEELEAMILAVDPERERISLGVKQLGGDPFSNFVAEHGKGSVVTGKVISLEAKGATIELAGDVEGYLRASELSRERVEDARSALKEGDTVEAKITTIDRKNRKISLSVKAKDLAEETEAVQEYARKSSSAISSLGQKLREKLKGNSELS
jgi:small subunit ribosomal protein S1